MGGVRLSMNEGLEHLTRTLLFQYAYLINQLVKLIKPAYQGGWTHILNQPEAYNLPTSGGASHKNT
jgi:hypothetical protein